MEDSDGQKNESKIRESKIRESKTLMLENNPEVFR